MSLDTEGGKQFTPEEREAIKRELRMAAEELYAGQATVIVVTDYDVGRALVAGEAPILKEAIDDLSRARGPGPLKSPTADFHVVDFTQFQDPEVLLRQTLGAIEEIYNVNPLREGKSFNDAYPGKIMAIIGAERIPVDSNILNIGILPKRAPTVFIQREGTKVEEGNRGVFRAIGEYTNMLHRIRK